MYEGHNIERSRHKLILVIAAAFVASVIGIVSVLYLVRNDAIPALPVYSVFYGESTTSSERSAIESFRPQLNDYDVSIDVVSSSKVDDGSDILSSHVFVVDFHSVVTNVLSEDLASYDLIVRSDVDASLVDEFEDFLGVEITTVDAVDTTNFTDNKVLILPIEQLDHSFRLLEFNSEYYLDTLTSGALFREVTVTTEDKVFTSNFTLYSDYTSDKLLTFNQTGVTALTRVMQRKLDQVVDPLHFSANIGEFLADADITHISNEVSFLEGCTYSNTSFCSPPEFIETLKASGVDVVGITGNHNNDRGSEANASTIELYKSLGWDVVGGGLNVEDAKVPYEIELKDTKVTLLAYNNADGPGSGALAGATTAGANAYGLDRVKSEIITAKETSDFVIVDIQYWECYSYPNGYVEFPICDKPIANQESSFKALIDAGADMVIGISAHQPQTYELYKGKPIYYGLGNLYFDQTSWPGTERGIVLTHYFYEGKLLQTKLTPTVYDRDLQIRVSTPSEAEFLLQRLNDAR